jgi:hypothetical protein
MRFDGAEVRRRRDARGMTRREPGAAIGTKMPPPSAASSTATAAHSQSHAA